MSDNFNKLCCKYGLKADWEFYKGLVFVHDEEGGCKIFTTSEVDTLPDIESELVEMCVRKLWG
jgi:hypothetical protein